MSVLLPGEYVPFVDMRKASDGVSPSVARAFPAVSLAAPTALSAAFAISLPPLYLRKRRENNDILNRGSLGRGRSKRNPGSHHLLQTLIGEHLLGLLRSSTIPSETGSER
jgi:hypothetical protein